MYSVSLGSSRRSSLSKRLAAAAASSMPSLSRLRFKLTRCRLGYEAPLSDWSRMWVTTCSVSYARSAETRER